MTDDARLGGVDIGAGNGQPISVDVLARLAEAEQTLRAISAGEVDAFVVAGAGVAPRVFSLDTADRPYRMFVEHMRDGAATVSPDGLILYVNQRLADLLRSSRQAMVGSMLSSILASEVVPLPGGQFPETFDCDLVDAAGHHVPVRIASFPLDDEPLTPTCLTITDLTEQRRADAAIAELTRLQSEQLRELRQAQGALIRQAMRDSLTGLPNRAVLIDRIDQALAWAYRSRHCLAVYFIDLDGFKRVNDTHGHAVGDAVLRRVARQLTTMLRPMDTVARIGGDEFVVLTPEVDSVQHAMDIAARFVAELCRRPDHEDSGIVGASVGVSVSLGRGTAESMMHEADQAMYQAKSRGGGRAELFSVDIGEMVAQRSLAQSRLQLALDDGRLVNHYQPVIDLGTGEVTGYEALARIIDLDGSLLSPRSFIAVAEDSGLVRPLGAHVLEMACAAAVRWPNSASGAPLTVAVNVSARQFETGDLVAQVASALRRSGLMAEELLLELTETAIIDLRADTIDQLDALIDLGVRIGLDDFGTGYATLTHLRVLTLDFVKIDRSFVAGLCVDRNSERIVAAVIDLAAKLGLSSIAEGVETTEQLNRLRDLGCDQAQGYLIARPAPGHQLEPTARFSC